MPWKEVEPMELKKSFAREAIQKGANLSELCRSYGISRKTGYKWKQRFNEQGNEGLREASRRPDGHAHQLDEDSICRLIRLKQAHPTWGPKKIRELYRRQSQGGRVMSESSIKRVFKKLGYVTKKHKRRVTYSDTIRTSWRAQEVNDVWTVDFKGWWHYNHYKKCNPLTIRDEKSRYILVLEHVDRGRYETVKPIFEAAFKKYGMPKAIRSDNGAPFGSSAGILKLSKLSAWFISLGIRIERNRPGCPQDNGAHERMHRDMAEELERYKIHTQEEFDLWRREYNNERPHEALGMKMPAEVYRKSSRRYEGEDQRIDYDGMLSRKINNKGYMSWHSRWYKISMSLTGRDVGLRKIDDCLYEVWYGDYFIGEFDDQLGIFIRVERLEKQIEKSNQKCHHQPPQV